MTDDLQQQVETLKGEVTDLTRIVKHLRQQLPIHAENTEAALQTHAGAMKAHSDMVEQHRDIAANYESLKNDLPAIWKKLEEIEGKLK